jgi:hypothetical protein
MTPEIDRLSSQFWDAVSKSGVQVPGDILLMFNKAALEGNKRRIALAMMLLAEEINERADKRMDKKGLDR